MQQQSKNSELTPTEKELIHILTEIGMDTEQMVGSILILSDFQTPEEVDAFRDWILTKKPTLQTIKDRVAEIWMNADDDCYEDE